MRIRIHHFNLMQTDSNRDRAPHQSDGNLKPPVYRSFTTPFLASTHPLWVSTTLQGSILSLHNSWVVSCVWAPNLDGRPRSHRFVGAMGAPPLHVTCGGGGRAGLWCIPPTHVVMWTTLHTVPCYVNSLQESVHVCDYLRYSMPCFPRLCSSTCLHDVYVTGRHSTCLRLSSTYSALFTSVVEP